jgi:maleamate amidohydrolase
VTVHAGGFGSSLGWGRRPALLLVDMMQAYFTPGSPMCLPDRSAVGGCAALVSAARAAGLPVVHTRVAYTEGLRDGGLFVRKIPALEVLTEGSELGAFVPELVPLPGEVVIVKQYASAFFGTSLASTLRAAEIDTVLIGGVSTSGCIRASATDAMQHGFRPLVVTDACGDRDNAVHTANLFDLEAKYADLVQVADVCAHLGTEHRA